jgi:hypothetical protein
MPKSTQGVLGEKLGMTQVFDANNRMVPVTVVKAGPCVVTQIRTPDKDGYSAVQIAYGAIDPRKVNKPEAGHFAKAGVTPRRHLVELRTDDATEYTLGQEITAALFEAGQRVDVVANSKGKGTAGVMKRHGFHGSVLLTARTATTASPVPSAVRPPRPGVQGNEDGGSARCGPDVHAEPHRPRGRRRQGAAPHQGRHPWPEGRAGVRAYAGEGAELMTARVDVIGIDGTKDGTVQLPPEIFDVQVNVPLIHQVVVAQLAAARQGTHSTKSRARCVAAAASLTARRARAVPAKARSGRRSSQAAG